MLPPRPESALPSPLGALAERLGDIESRLEELGEQSALQQLRLMTLPSRLPVLGAAIGSAFGNRVDPLTGRKAFHAGLDFPAEYGSPILASAGGRVVFAGVRPDYGWTVEIAHGDGLVTRYAHASKLFVRTGDIVAPGERIALVGSTGRSTGPHLHYEVLRNGEHKDPRRFIAGL
jgi:murein DD-endopeptidase MepM/ murein hydrolase activator NlpD